MSAVFIVMGGWLITFCLIAGLGHIVRSRGFGLTVSTLDAWFESFWLGYVVVIGALQVWQLAQPIDYRVTLLLALGGAVGFIAALRGAIGRRLPKIQSVVFILALLPITVWIANRGLDRQLDIDTGFYHLSSIRWLNDYPIVPGLGNLHYRLAFNQTFFLFVAALNVYPLFNQGFHIANSLLLMVVAAQSLYHVLYLLRYPDARSPYRLLSALFLPVILYRATYDRFLANLSSPSPDLGVFLFQVVVALAFVRYLFETTAEEREQRARVFFILAVSAVGITSKLSFAAFGVAVAVLTLIIGLERNRQTLRVAARQAALWLLIVGGGVGLVWSARGAITSGFLLFPSSFGALPVDYRIPPVIRREAENWVYSFARQPRGDMDVVLSNWDWINGWLPRMQDGMNPFLFVIPFLAACALLILLAVIWLVVGIVRRATRPDSRYLLLIISAALAGLFWFLTAPDPRFAGSAFWILALWSAVCLLVTLLAPLRRTPQKFVTRLLSLVIVAAAGLVVASGYERGVHLTGIDFPNIPATPVESYRTQSGLMVYVSADPDNSLLLWDAPLPASPYRQPALSQRGGSLGDGFRLPADATLNPPGS